MNTSPDYVHPVAENFTDFLRLILACGDVAAVEQAWMWNEAPVSYTHLDVYKRQEQNRSMQRNVFALSELLQRGCWAQQCDSVCAQSNRHLPVLSLIHI